MAETGRAELHGPMQARFLVSSQPSGEGEAAHIRSRYSRVLTSKEQWPQILGRSLRSKEPTPRDVHFEAGQKAWAGGYKGRSGGVLLRHFAWCSSHWPHDLRPKVPRLVGSRQRWAHSLGRAGMNIDLEKTVRPSGSAVGFVAQDGVGKRGNHG